MGKQILIVEDHPLNLELARDLLEAHGYTVAAAGDAKECLARIGEQRPDLILMDVQLPGKDGLQITAELRANPATQSLRIVAMTAHAMAADAQRARAAGCDGYLTKPIQTRTFVDQISAFLDGTSTWLGAPHPEKAQP
ncbi:MAG: two-component hybrid sensor and regulator [Chloroflexi bacterium]|nr:two-component hybrid sensor and regulator [Chloroflexota bacterium]